MTIETNIAPELKSGDKIQIVKQARPDVVGGIRSAKNDLPLEVITATVRKITKTKNGRKIHVHNVFPAYHGAGFAIIGDQMPGFMTVEKITA